VITTRRATVDDAPAIAAFQRAEGYDWPIWTLDSLKANLAAGDHVHIMLAFENKVLVGFIHWVDIQVEGGVDAGFVGAIVSKALSPSDRLAYTHTLALLMGPALGMKGRWRAQASKEDREAIAYAQLVLPDVILDCGDQFHYEGDVAATYAHISTALTGTP